jgi:hypothetical protein
MAEAQICEVQAILAPHNVGSCNGSSKVCSFYLGNYSVECKPTT